MGNTFHVDLQGMVDLLSRNLYSGPRVYVRELLQNAHDAVVARRERESTAPNNVVIRIEGSTLTCTDTGIGLTPTQAETFLSTIGSSSKRDELGMVRGDFLGQFGIGLLSCFMVSSTITVYSRSAATDDAPTIRWQGSVNGTYDVDTLPADDPNTLPEPGTRIELQGRSFERWIEPATVRALVDEFASYLNIHVQVVAEGRTTTHCQQVPPWELIGGARIEWCKNNLGFEPVDIIELNFPVAGFKGIAAVMPTAQTAQGARDTAYVKGMLVSKDSCSLTPPWCYFVRVVAGADNLRLTASREQLADDDLLGEVREEVGKQVLAWLEKLSRTSPQRFLGFISTHAAALLQVALEDPGTLKIIARTFPMQTTQGPMTLVEMASHGRVRWTRTSDHFAALAEVGASQGVLLVNAGHTHEEELIAAWLASGAEEADKADFALVNPEEMLESFAECSPEELAEAADLMLLAPNAIPADECEVVLRRFEPESTVAVHLPDPDLAQRLLEKRAKKNAKGVWKGLLNVADSFSNDAVPLLVLNRANPVATGLITSHTPAERRIMILRGIYVQSLLAGRQPLGAKEREWAAEVMGTLLSSALD
ncbi:MAG: HSP90 family protein [Actinomycetaceae bacterium]|nr:HSP90 family protein [Actinomycetaceae bacterium]